MNNYTELLRYIRTLGEADPFINTITQGDFDAVDSDKANVMPLLHIDVTGGSFTNGQTVIFSVELASLFIRDENKEVNSDKFYNNDNEVDNFNESLAVINRLWGKMYKDFGNNNITASENPSFTPIDYRSTKNNLEGWLLSFDVEMPNTTISLCQ